jgi:hypothetical protein
MSDQRNDEDIQKWQRWFAVECNNRAWRLSEAPSRSPAEDNEMLNAAHAAAFHWSKIGTEVHAARVAMLLGHVHALLGQGTVAMRYAKTSFDSVTSRESPDWEIALAHAVLANAASAVNDTVLHSHHYAQAQRIGLALPNAEERGIFEATFSRIPAPQTLA